MTETGVLPAIATLAVAYLCGSIPFGLILTKLAGMGDIRAIGSGNIGATNVLRTGRRGIAALTMLLDCAKGAAPVVLVNFLWPEQLELRAATGVLAFLGHLYPVWLGFKGGKGVATTAGVVLGLSVPAAAIGGGLWILLLLGLRYSSVAALVAVTVTPFSIWYFSDIPAVIATAIIALLVWVKHRANIRRLIAGEEPKVRFSSSS